MKCMLRSRPGQAGFSAIELIMVVAVILVISVIAVPRMLQARIKAKEAAAIASMKAIQNAQMLYAQTFPEQGYATKLVFLGSPSGSCDSISFANACMIDSVLASGIKGGYLFDIQGDGNIPDLTYKITATPDGSGTLGSSQCAFSSDQGGVIQGQSVNQQTASKLSVAVSSAGCGGK